MPEQTVKNKNVDIVVRGDGDETIVEIVKAIENNKSLKKIKGISFKNKIGKIITTENRLLSDINN